MNWYRLSRITGETLNILGLLFPPWCYSFAQGTQLNRLTHTKQIRSQNSQVIWYNFSGLRYRLDTHYYRQWSSTSSFFAILLMAQRTHGSSYQKNQEKNYYSLDSLLQWSVLAYLLASGTTSTSTKPVGWIQGACTAQLVPAKQAASSPQGCQKSSQIQMT